MCSVTWLYEANPKQRFQVFFDMVHVHTVNFILQCYYIISHNYEKDFEYVNAVLLVMSFGLIVYRMFKSQLQNVFNPLPEDSKVTKTFLRNHLIALFHIFFGNSCMNVSHAKDL